MTAIYERIDAMPSWRKLERITMDMLKSVFSGMTTICYDHCIISKLTISFLKYYYYIALFRNFSTSVCLVRSGVRRQNRMAQPRRAA